MSVLGGKSPLEFGRQQLSLAPGDKAWLGKMLLNMLGKDAGKRCVKNYISVKILTLNLIFTFQVLLEPSTMLILEQ